MKDYLNVAIENEMVFRAILTAIGINHAPLTIAELYHTFSAGDPTSGVKIDHFEKKGDVVYEMTSFYGPTFSDYGKTESWSFKDGALQFIETTQTWIA